MSVHSPIAEPEVSAPDEEKPLGAGTGPQLDAIVDTAADMGRPTPLPKLQLLILFYIQLAEPIASTVIYPFVNQLVRETGVTRGDQRKTGYFAGRTVTESRSYFWLTLPLL